MPVSIEVNGAQLILGPGPGKVTIEGFGKRIFWHGDDDGTLVVMDTGGVTASFNLRVPGQEVGIPFDVYVPAVEKGQPPNVMQRLILFARIGSNKR